MIVTEDEARTKRCQESFGDSKRTTGGEMVSIPVFGGPATSAGMAVVTSPSHCIGSACMAWRWLGWQVDSQLGTKQFTLEKYTEYSHRVAYCGKAGKP